MCGWGRVYVDGEECGRRVCVCECVCVWKGKSVDAVCVCECTYVCGRERVWTPCVCVCVCMCVDGEECGRRVCVCECMSVCVWTGRRVWTLSHTAVQFILSLLPEGRPDNPP